MRGPAVSPWSPEKTQANAWRERGYHDGRAGRPPRTPLSASEEGRSAYLVGYRNGRAKRT